MEPDSSTTLSLRISDSASLRFSIPFGDDATPPSEENEGTSENMPVYVKNTLSCSCNRDTSASLHKTERVNSEIIEYPVFSITYRTIAWSTDEFRFNLG